MIEFSAFDHDGEPPRDLTGFERVIARAWPLIIGAVSLALWGAIIGAVNWVLG